MNLIEELGLEKCKAIVEGAPEGSHLFFHFCRQFKNRVDYYKYFFNHFQMWLPDHGWFPIHEDLAEDALNLEDLRTAIAAYDCNPTDNLSHLTDNCTDISNHDLSVSNPSQNDKQIDLSIKMDIEDNCTDIRNHLSPNTKVIER